MAQTPAPATTAWVSSVDASGWGHEDDAGSKEEPEQNGLGGEDGGKDGGGVGTTDPARQRRGGDDRGQPQRHEHQGRDDLAARIGGGQRQVAVTWLGNRPRNMT